MTSNLVVFGIYADRPTVDNALVELRAAGFRNTDVSILLPKNLGSGDRKIH
jgi:hypothetical protein